DSAGGRRRRAESAGRRGAPGAAGAARAIEVSLRHLAAVRQAVMPVYVNAAVGLTSRRSVCRPPGAPGEPASGSGRRPRAPLRRPWPPA
ncbi:hypothetical protein AB1399_08935, partial [Hydrogenibacillus schlegelii]|uniref:hypothetical protein n=1 Tax=Hydrogenibacillus schlegelii TaxID=1484 RepID=UPI0034A04955